MTWYYWKLFSFPPFPVGLPQRWHQWKPPPGFTNKSRLHERNRRSERKYCRIEFAARLGPLSFVSRWGKTAMVTEPFQWRGGRNHGSNKPCRNWRRPVLSPPPLAGWLPRWPSLRPSSVLIGRPKRNRIIERHRDPLRSVRRPPPPPPHPPLTPFSGIHQLDWLSRSLQIRILIFLRHASDRWQHLDSLHYPYQLPGYLDSFILEWSAR